MSKIYHGDLREIPSPMASLPTTSATKSMWSCYRNYRQRQDLARQTKVLNFNFLDFHLFFQGASKLAHIMHGSSCCTVLAVVFTDPNKKETRQTEKFKAHCSEAEVLISCYRKPNMMELITNSTK